MSLGCALAFVASAPAAFAQPPQPAPRAPAPAHVATAVAAPAAHAPASGASVPPGTAPVAPKSAAAPIGPVVHLASPAPSAGPARVYGAPRGAQGLRHDAVRATPWGDARTLPVHGEEKRLWRVANRINPGFARDRRDRFTAAEPGPDSAEARHINCVYSSLALEDALAGHPAVAMPGWAKARMPAALVAAKRAALGADFASRYTEEEEESVLYSERFPNVVFERTDDVKVLAKRLADSGEGSRMILTGAWEHRDAKGAIDAAGLHAFNMVNLGGKVVVVDGQSGEISTPEVYFSDVRWFNFHFHVTQEGGPGKSPLPPAP